MLKIFYHQKKKKKQLGKCFCYICDSEGNTKY